MNKGGFVSMAFVMGLVAGGLLILSRVPAGAMRFAAEGVTAYPGPGTPWYATGFLPVLLIGGSLAVLLAVTVWAMNITRMRRFSGGNE